MALRNAEIRARQARIRSSYRGTLAAVLVDEQRQGIVALRADARDVAAVLIALGQGLATETLADPAWDRTGAVACARASPGTCSPPDACAAALLARADPAAREAHPPDAGGRALPGARMA